MIYIRIFSNTIEISSPGGWSSRSLPQNKLISLSKLSGESIQRNMRLAHAISSVNLVEMEGSGIPRAILECIEIGAPEPIVVERDGYITVTIYPRNSWDTKSRYIFLSYSRKDRERIVALVTALKNEGFKVWWDDNSIRAIYSRTEETSSAPISMS